MASSSSSSSEAVRRSLGFTSRDANAYAFELLGPGSVGAADPRHAAYLSIAGGGRRVT